MFPASASQPFLFFLPSHPPSHPIAATTSFSP
jgi:hypothetical protein